MRIVADENIPQVKDAFSRFGDVRVLSGRQISPNDVHDTDVLLVRSVTRVNKALLKHSSVRFVGSATIGTDHVDLAWLAQQGIAFANAPGCNAISAAEYVMSALFAVAERDSLNLKQMTMGIVGCGNVGSQVKLRAEALGIQCLVCDPPRADAEGPQGFVDMQAMAQCDIVSVHVPLIKDGSHPTHQLINSDFLAQLKADAIFINTSRGDVVDEVALLKKVMSSSDLKLVLDVWENEPLINKDLARRAQIATPHIAGYSMDGKIRATTQLYHVLSDFLGEPADDPDWAHLPAPKENTIMPVGEDAWSVMSSSIKQAYDIRRDDRELKELMALEDEARAKGFDRLRKQYWPRRECSAYGVSAERLTKDAIKALEVYGFTVS